MLLESKTAIITGAGAGRGIGFATAKLFAEHGARTALLDIDATEYDAVMNVNLRGNFHMAQAVIPHMRHRGGGAIVCISSIAGRMMAR